MICKVQFYGDSFFIVLVLCFNCFPSHATSTDLSVPFMQSFPEQNSYGFLNRSDCLPFAYDAPYPFFAPKVLEQLSEENVLKTPQQEFETLANSDTIGRSLQRVLSGGRIYGEGEASDEGAGSAHGDNGRLLLELRDPESFPRLQRQRLAFPVQGRRDKYNYIADLKSNILEGNTYETPRISTIGRDFLDTVGVKRNGFDIFNKKYNDSTAEPVNIYNALKNEYQTFKTNIDFENGNPYSYYNIVKIANSNQKMKPDPYVHVITTGNARVNNYTNHFTTSSTSQEEKKDITKEKNKPKGKKGLPPRTQGNDKRKNNVDFDDNNMPPSLFSTVKEVDSESKELETNPNTGVALCGFCQKMNGRVVEKGKNLTDKKIKQIYKTSTSSNSKKKPTVKTEREINKVGSKQTQSKSTDHIGLDKKENGERKSKRNQKLTTCHPEECIRKIKELLASIEPCTTRNQVRKGQKIKRKQEHEINSSTHQLNRRRKTMTAEDDETEVDTKKWGSCKSRNSKSMSTTESLSQGKGTKSTQKYKPVSRKNMPSNGRRENKYERKDKEFTNSDSKREQKEIKGELVEKKKNKELKENVESDEDIDEEHDADTDEGNSSNISNSKETQDEIDDNMDADDGEDQDNKPYKKEKDKDTKKVKEQAKIHDEDNLTKEKIHNTEDTKNNDEDDDEDEYLDTNEESALADEEDLSEEEAEFEDDKEENDTILKSLKHKVGFFWNSVDTIDLDRLKSNPDIAILTALFIILVILVVMFVVVRMFSRKHDLDIESGEGFQVVKLDYGQRYDPCMGCDHNQQIYTCQTETNHPNSESYSNVLKALYLSCMKTHHKSQMSLYSSLTELREDERVPRKIIHGKRHIKSTIDLHKMDK